MITADILEKRMVDFIDTLFNSEEKNIDIKNLDVNADLIEEIGLDSLEAFETIIALHEFLGVEMPEDIEVETISTLHGIANYILENYDQEIIVKFMKRDLSELAEMRKVDEDIEI